MSSARRIRRPKLKRTEPIRSWTTVPGAGGAETSAAESAAADTARRADSGSPFGDVIARSVDLGYRVVDGYIRQGQKAAERLTNRGAAPEAIASDVQDAAMRMTQYASEFMGLWFEMLGLASVDGNARASSLAPEAPAGTPAPAPPANATFTGDATRVHVELASVHPVEVVLDLRPGATQCPLTAQALRAGDPALPPLTEVGFTRSAADEPVRLHVRVPAAQPAGTYNGLVTDARTNRPVGTVSVRVGRG